MFLPQTGTMLKAEAVALAIEKLTGEKPYISYAPAGTDLYFTPAQVEKIKPVLTALIDKKPTPADRINIHAAPIVAPIILKKAAPFIVGLVALGYVLGKL